MDGPHRLAAIVTGPRASTDERGMLAAGRQLLVVSTLVLLAASAAVFLFS